MPNRHLLAQLEALGFHSEDAYRREAFSRNIGLLTEAEQERLRNARVAIAGMGGVGGSHLITLVRLGIGRFNLADFDSFEPANVNRQYGARVPDFGRSKLDVMVEEAARINPFVEINAFHEGTSNANIDEFLEDVDVVLDGIDFFNFDVRRLLFNRSREKGIFVITAGPLGFSSAMLIFSPSEGMSFDEYFNIRDDMDDEEKLLTFGIGLAPAGLHIRYMDFSKINLRAGKGPSLCSACQLCSSMASTEVLRIILRRDSVKPVPHYFQFDPHRQKYRTGFLWLGNRNPVQLAKIYYVRKFLLSRNQGHRRAAPELPQVETSLNPLPPPIFEYILEAGIQAPSGDNAQPWKFAGQGNTIFVYVDKAADHSFFNVNQIASIISCGAVIENMKIAATLFGLETRITCLPDGKDSDLMAAVEFYPAKKGKDPLHDLIWERCTNRRFYLRDPIPEGLIHHLVASVSSFSGARLHLLTEEPCRRKLARIVYKVDRIRTEHRPLHEHLHRMIRYTEQEASRSRDGFPLKNLEAGIAGEFFLKWTRPWSVMNAVNGIGLGRMVALHSYQAMKASSAAGLLTISGRKPQDLLTGGRALQHLWLEITKNNLSMQPMTAVTLFWHRWHEVGGRSFSTQHRRLLSNVWREYQQLFPQVDFETEAQIMLFRIGYGKEISCGTYRKDIQAFLVKNNY